MTCLNSSSAPPLSQSSFRPSRLQFAIALAVVKSKPPELTIREHVERLREQIKRGTGALPPESSHCYIAGVVYWRKMYEEAQADKAKLRSEIDHLKQENAGLYAQLKAVDLEKRAVQPSEKRRRAEAEPTRDSRSAKRTKAARARDDSPQSAQGLEKLTADDFQTSDITGEAGVDALMHLHVLHRLCQEYKIETRALAFALVQTASATGAVLTTACAKMHRGLDTSASSSEAPKQKQQFLAKEQMKRDEEFASLIRGVARIFSSLTFGLEKMTSSEPDSCENRSRAIYALVKVFDRVLQCISDYLVKEVDLGDTDLPDTAAQRKAQKHTKKQDIPKSMAQLLSAMLFNLDPNSAAQRELFEGFVFVLLQRMGKRLYTWTMNRERTATVENDIDKTLHHNPANGEPQRLLEKQYPKREAFYLILILERALSVAPHHLDLQPLAPKYFKVSATSSKHGTTPRAASISSRTVLSLDAKERLQKTLVKGIFGHDDEMVLRMPARLPPIPQPPDTDEGDVGRWYVQELWRLVGWDILRKVDE